MSKGAGALMTDAREIIFEALLDCPIYYGDGDKATSVIYALTTSGYRILAPGELDKETVERCAGVAEAEAEAPKIHTRAAVARITAAIRSLEVSNG